MEDHIIKIIGQIFFIGYISLMGLVLLGIGIGTTVDSDRDFNPKD